MSGTQQNNPYVRYSGLAVQMLVIIAAGSIGGVKLDQWLRMTIPVCTIILSALSIALAIFVAIRDIDNKPEK